MVAVECGADALGFVFYEPSPRFISIQKAREIVRALPPFVEKVGLFVHKEADFIDEVCLHVGLGLAQLHWEVGDDFMSMLTTPSLLVVRAKSKDDLTQFNDKYRLVDAFVDGFGGAGKRVELEWFKEIDCSKIILAGGLEAHQMESLKPFGFYGVDVSSGVEKSKGVKDAQKIEQFIKAAKA